MPAAPRRGARRPHLLERLGQQVPYTCGGNSVTGIGDGNGGESKSNDRRVWLRLRTASGQLSQIVGSIVRFSDARIPRACGGGPLLYDQQVTEVGGVEQAPATLNAVADKGEPVSFSFRTNAARKAAQDDQPANVNGIGWRIRNSHTGKMFVRNGDDWVTCAEPCTSEDIYSTANGAGFANMMQAFIYRHLVPAESWLVSRAKAVSTSRPRLFASSIFLHRPRMKRTVPSMKSSRFSRRPSISFATVW